MATVTQPAPSQSETTQTQAVDFYSRRVVPLGLAHALWIRRLQGTPDPGDLEVPQPGQN
jgi:hypothetical protein